HCSVCPYHLALLDVRKLLSGPDISVVASSPTWVWRDNYLIKLTLTFVNSGARAGVVEDMILRFESEDGGVRCLYSLLAVVNEERFIQPRSQPDTNWVKSSFYPIAIGGRQSISESVIFNYSPSNLDRNLSGFAPNRLRVLLLTEQADHRRSWSRQATFSVPFDHAKIGSALCS